MNFRIYDVRSSDYLMAWITQGDPADQMRAFLDAGGSRNHVVQEVVHDIPLTRGFVPNTNNWRKLHGYPKKHRNVFVPPMSEVMKNGSS